MSPVSASYEDTWGSEAEQENGQTTPQKLRASSALRPPPSSASTPAESEANDALIDSVNPSDSLPFAGESTVIQKTGWLVLRSTAKSLNNVLRNVGVSGVRVRQMYDSKVPPQWNVKFFLLLYKWIPERGDGLKWNPDQTPHTYAVPSGVTMQDDWEANTGEEEPIMFSCQSMENASATQALIMAVMNIPEDRGQDGYVPFVLGEDLARLKAFMKPMDPAVRSAAIASSLAVRTAHNKAAREQPGGHPDIFDEDGRLQNIALADELWMYTVYIPNEDNNIVYELHGVADEAKVLGYCDEDDSNAWTTMALRAAGEKGFTFQDHNVPFLFFAVTSDRKRSGLPRLPRKRRNGSEDGMETGSSADQESDEDGKDGSSMGNPSADVDSDRPDTIDEPDQETVKDEVQRIRATHNYDPFFVEFMKLLASRGDLNRVISNYPEQHASATEDEEDG